MRTKNNHENILVFAGKDVGARTLSFLLENKYPVKKIIATNDSDDAIEKIAAAHTVDFEFYSSATFSQLIDENSHFDWLLNLWGNRIIPSSVLDLCTRRLNLHPGLVPDCRGSDCAAWAIRKGLKAGVSLIEMDAGVDTGDIYYQEEVKYSPFTKGKQLQHLLLEKLVEVFQAQWPQIFEGNFQLIPQLGPVTTFTRKQTNRDKRIMGDERIVVKDFLNWATSHDFSPVSTAEVVIDNNRYKLTINLEPIGGNGK